MSEEKLELTIEMLIERNGARQILVALERCCAEKVRQQGLAFNKTKYWAKLGHKLGQALAWA